MPRNAISLFLEVDATGAIARRWHARTRIVNDDATTYDAFDADPAPHRVAARGLLRGLSGAREADEMVAWWCGPTQQSPPDPTQQSPPDPTHGPRRGHASDASCTPVHPLARPPLAA